MTSDNVERGQAPESGFVGDARQKAAGQWLLCAAVAGTEQGQREWETEGVTLLRCGGLLTAVHVPAELVQAAAGSTDPDVISGYLARMVRGGGVFFLDPWQQYYFLISAWAARHWLPRPGVTCQAPDSRIGVPSPALVGPNASERAYWVVPMCGPGSLCEGRDVVAVIAAGYRSLSQREPGGVS